MINEKEIERIIDALENGGEIYECGGQVVYGWKISSRGVDPADEAAELLRELLKELNQARAKFIPIAKVHVKQTGGNPGLAWSAVSLDSGGIHPKDGEILYIKE